MARLLHQEVNVEDRQQGNASLLLFGEPLGMSPFIFPFTARAGASERRPSDFVYSHSTMTRVCFAWAGSAASCMTRQWSAMDADDSIANIGDPPLYLLTICCDCTTTSSQNR